MVFSDTSTNQGLIQDITFLTGASLTEYPIADRTRNINEWARKVLVKILTSQDEWDFDDSNHTDFPILSGDLVSGQRDYSLPISSEGMLQIKSVEISDGSKFYLASPIDKSEQHKAVSNDDIDSLYSKSEPRYDLQYGSLFVYPLPSANITNGLKIWINRDISPFTASDTTKTPGFDPVFHRILSFGAAYDWALARGGKNLNLLFASVNDLMNQLGDYYSKKQDDRQNAIKSINRNYNWR